MTTPPIIPEEELPAGEAHEELETTDELKRLETEQFNDVMRERDEYKDGWMRAKADLMNHKKQEAERVSSALRMGMQGMVSDILLVLDSFDLAISALANDAAGEQGMRIIRSQLLEVLKRYGVEPIPSADLVGKDFDPVTSEAMGTQPSELPEGTVVSVLQEGYRMNGNVVRAARVYVAAPAQS